MGVVRRSSVRRRRGVPRRALSAWPFAVRSPRSTWRSSSVTLGVAAALAVAQVPHARAGAETRAGPRPPRRGVGASCAVVRHARARNRSRTAALDPERELPGWPVLALLWGMPAWWAFGLLPFIC